MNEPLTIKLKTLTPLWTGGVDGKSDRLHATSIIGSLRWWYEAVVRGLGGYVCDPTSEKAEDRSEFDTKAYEQAKRDKLSEAESLQTGLKTVCPVSYLFGTTGWARLFQLQILEAPTTPLHFRTSMNQSWLKRVFGGESQNIDNLSVPYGELQFRFVPRGHAAEYVQNQFLLTMHFAAAYGGLGARLQHGFGQCTPILPAELEKFDLKQGMRQLAQRLTQSDLRSSGKMADTPIDLCNFVSLTYDITQSKLSAFIGANAHCGSSAKQNEQDYLPCAFDLRYKGSGSWGMRRWLEDPNGTKRWQLDRINDLMGISEKKGKKINDADRQAGHLFFSMPYRLANNTYRLRIFGFAPPHLLTPEGLGDLCNEYIQYALQIQPQQVMLGQELIAQVNEGGQQ